MRWIIDGNNVMGAVPDGWWKDRTGSLVRLAGRVADWSTEHDDDVVFVVDHRPEPAIAAAGESSANVEVRFADRPGRDAADDVIAAMARPGDRVVTADRGLRARLTNGVDVIGPRTFLDLLSD
ncbi:MAG: DUF188 domain-containing protein [Actinomycetota bacterium]